MTNFQHLLSSTEDELLLDLGRALTEEDLGALPQNLDALRERSTRWLNARKTQLQSLICKSEKVQQLATTDNSLELLVAVIDVLESATLGTSAAPVAAILCKRGLRKLCAAHWAE